MGPRTVEHWVGSEGPAVTASTANGSVSGVANQGSNAREGSLAHPETGLQLCELRSNEQARLLNAIDGLRREHIDADISIPQIVVCGNQSSGKSSVLEAIARVPFPIGTNTTTRFATEISLRHSTNVEIKVQIIASADRCESQKRAIEDFQPDIDISDRKDLGLLIQAAATHLQSVEPEKTFWNDLLRAEVSGPDQPHLTLVDLPGMIQSEEAAQARLGDKAKIDNLIRTYIRDDRTTVLAVVDAMNDVANQGIFTLIRGVGNSIRRTLGVITKPDLPKGRDMLNNIINLARNDTITLDLGWHVIRNLGHEEDDRSFAERDTLEREFFNKIPWNRLSGGDVGINNLRIKLKTQLFETISRDLPILTSETRRRRRECSDCLERLGPGRDTVGEQRAYLAENLNKLQRLIEAALKGDYDHTEFASFFDGSPRTGLRDSINLLTNDFATKIRKYGRQCHVHTTEAESVGRPKRSDLNDLSPSIKPNFFPPYTVANTGGGIPHLKTVNVSMDVYCCELAQYMERTRGQNLPGILSTNTVKAVFRQQSVFWAALAEEYGERCYKATYETFLTSAITHISGSHTGEALLREYIRHIRAGKRGQLDDKIKELLWPFTESHPMTYNLNYSAGTVWRSDPNSCDAYQSFGEIAEANDFDEQRVAAAVAMDGAEAFYEIALDRFIDEVATLGVERCLLHELPSIIPSREASIMEDEKVERIAAERPEARRERTKLKAQLASLEDAIGVFQTYSDHRREPATSRTGSRVTSSMQESPASANTSRVNNTSVDPASQANPSANERDPERSRGGSTASPLPSAREGTTITNRSALTSTGTPIFNSTPIIPSAASNRSRSRSRSGRGLFAIHSPFTQSVSSMSTAPTSVGNSTASSSNSIFAQLPTPAPLSATFTFTPPTSQPQRQAA